jgi:dTDP-4-amino-4,6-dideoxy-D-galactose acyltransferase
MLYDSLEWDSNFFGSKIARINGSHIDEKKIELIDQGCTNNRIDCLYFLCDAADQNSIRLAEDHNFHLMDIRVVFEKQIPSSPVDMDIASPYIVRLSQPDDVSELTEIAKISFHFTRFYNDPKFPRDLCDALYETWIRKSCDGSSDAVLVVEHLGEICAFVTCNVIDSERGEIGLIGVNPIFQGEGIGQFLISKAVSWFKRKDIKIVKVTTQGNNWKAQRLYQRSGFLTHSVQLWYHKWYL